MQPDDQQYGTDYFDRQLQVKRNRLRSLVRGFYLRKAAALCKGKTLDFGCGAGALLEHLPSGSVGIEINPHAAEYCQSRGLDVRQLDYLADPGVLSFLGDEQIQTIILNHVLEHFEQPEVLLKALMDSAAQHNVERIVIIVPCLLGFKCDVTHRTYITEDFFVNHGIDGYREFRLINKKIYPFNNRYIGNFFRYQELQVTLDRQVS